MTSQQPHFRCLFSHLPAAKNTQKMGQLWRHSGPSYFVMTLAFLPITSEVLDLLYRWIPEKPPISPNPIPNSSKDIIVNFVNVNYFQGFSKSSVHLELFVHFFRVPWLAVPKNLLLISPWSYTYSSKDIIVNLVVGILSYIDHSYHNYC